MVLKNSKKKNKKPWICYECKDSHKRICKHLEAKIPKPTGQSVFSIAVSNIENIAEYRDLEERAIDIEKFENLLQGYGLPQTFVNVLVLRFFCKASLAEISEELGILNKQKVYYIITKSCELLKERGFKLED